MSGKKANNNPRLCHIKKHKSHLCSDNGDRNQFSSLSLSTTKTAPHYQMLVIHTAFYLSFYTLPTDSQGWLRSYKILNRTVSCELVGSFISSYPSMSRDPIQSHDAPGRDIQHLWLCHTNGDTVLAAWRAFRATWLSQQILTSYSGLAFVKIS